MSEQKIFDYCEIEQFFSRLVREIELCNTVGLSIKTTHREVCTEIFEEGFDKNYCDAVIYEDGLLMFRKELYNDI